MIIMNEKENHHIFNKYLSFGSKV